MKKNMIVLFVTLMVIGIGAMNAKATYPSADYDAWKIKQIQETPSPVKPGQASNSFNTPHNLTRDCPLVVPYDADTFTQAMTPNDDGFLGPINLPFTFYLYGTEYTQLWINNNGNLTFDGGYSSYTPWGFPISGSPMVAPFFADVDTRGAGTVWYRIEDNNLVVIWDHVGYYTVWSNGTDKLNTFEVVISDGTFAPIGLGNNVAFSYADMSWTTGNASGGSGGFGGSAATVGINHGNGVDYAQIGRFDHAGTDYDGPYDNNDGVDWLDCKLFVFNTGLEAENLPPVFVTYPDPPTVTLAVGDTWTFTVTVISPEEGQITTATVDHLIPTGMSYVMTPGNTCEIEFTLTALPSNVGTYLVTMVATDDGEPPLSSSFEFTIIIEGVNPVELSSFNATLSSDMFVNIAWTSQTESQMLGYRVYRNTSADQSGAMLIDHPMVPATNTSQTSSYNVMDYDVMVGQTYYYWLESVEYNASSFHGPVSVTVNIGGDSPGVDPEIIALKNAYPNPFSAGSITNIEVSLKAGETGTLSIVNLAGQVVKTYQVGQGNHNIQWNGTDSNGLACGSGIYLYKLSTPSFNQTRKLVILK
ncbi:MAG: T9SS type A sorting domain-containing protein [Candidatus Cloacimonetes bacterium]|nr:T9SS type A sorting domain-containing protein [Candidatus Cloacimonadota bacterium]